MKDFGLPECQFVMHSKRRREIEKVFDKEELVALYRFAFGEEVRAVNKKQFLELMRILLVKVETEKREISSLIGDSTKERFKELLKVLKV